MSKLYGGKMNQAGIIVGKSYSWEELWKKQCVPGIKSIFNGKEIIDKDFSNSLYNEFSKHSLTINEFNCVIIYVPDELFNGKEPYWFFINAGLPLTTIPRSTGNIASIMMNSLAHVIFKYCKTGFIKDKNNLLDCVKWIIRILKEIKNNKLIEYKSAGEALENLLSSWRAKNVLHNLAMISLKHILGDKCNPWQLFNYTMVSLSRTYNDLSSLTSKEALDRIYVLMFCYKLMELNNLDKALKSSRTTIIELYKKNIKYFNDNKNELSMISTFIKFCFNNYINDDDLIVLSKIIWKKINSGRFPTINKHDIGLYLNKNIMVGTPFQINKLDNNGSEYKWNVRDGIIINNNINKIKVCYSDSKRWLTIGFKSLKTEGKWFIYGKFKKGNYGYPGIRVFSSPYITWRKRYQFGITTNGGTSDGYGKPKNDYNTPKTYIDNNEEKLIGIIKLDNGKLYGKFINWKKFKNIKYHPNNFIIISAKSCEITIKEDENYLKSGKDIVMRDKTINDLKYMYKNILNKSYIGALIKNL